jgi:hypothetical protein
MRLSQRLRYAVADLRQRLGMTALNVVAIALPVVYLLLLGFYGWVLYGYQRALLDESLGTLVVASCDDVNDPARRFTEAKLAELRRLPGVARAFSKVELGVKLSADGRTRVMVPAEGTVPGDPVVAGPRLAWGSGLSGPSAAEVILSQSLFQKLGGTLSQQGPWPETLSLEVGRTVDGQAQSHTLALRVVGLLRHQPADKVYVPLPLVERLDQWCSNQVSALSGADARPELPQLTYPLVHAYGPASARDRAAQEAELVHASAEPAGEVTVVAGGDVWAAVRRAKGDVTAADLGALSAAGPEFRFYPVRTLRLRRGDREVSLVALSPQDPRWRLAPGGAAPAFGAVLTATQADRDVADQVAGVAPDLPAGGNGYCTTDTRAWLAFDPREAAGLLRTYTLVSTTSPDVVRRIERGRPDDPRADRLPEWAAHEPPDPDEAPVTYTMLLSGDAKAAARELGADARRCTLTPLGTVAASLRVRGHPVGRLCAVNPDGGAGKAVVAEVGRDNRGTLSVGTTPVGETRLTAGAVPPGLALVDGPTFRRLAFEAARSAGPLPEAGVPGWAVQVSALRWTRLRDACAAAGLTWTPLTTVREERLVRYRIRRDGGADAGLTTDQVAALGMARPTFTLAVPRVHVEASLGGQALTLQGSQADDPARFEETVLRGRWLGEAPGHHEAILPLAAVRALFPGRGPEECLGRDVEVRFVRTKRLAAAEPALALPVRVVGLTAGGQGFTDLELLHGVALWQQGKAVYSDETRRFATPAEIYERSGHVRCNLHATDLNAVAPLVARLESLGYRTEHQLAELEALRKLGHVLVFLIVAFEVGFALLAVITVWITTNMNIRSKTWEIGILRAHGVGRLDVVSVFGLQALLLGGTAFLAGSLLALALEPPLTGLLRGTFRLPPGVVTTSLATPSLWWLFAVALVLAAAFPLVGAILPAARACRLPPVVALQRTD